MVERVDPFKLKLDYLGYKGINLENVSLKTFRNFISVMPRTDEKIYNLLLSLPTLSLNEVRELTKQFCQKYFSLSDISYVSTGKLNNNIQYITASQTSDELYDKVNSLLVNINPLDLPIDLVNGHSMVGELEKPIIMIP